jgi:hypothetical protein
LDTCPKPNNLKAVFAEQRILASHFGIGVALENVRRYQRALELVLGKSGNSTAGEPVAPVGRSPAPASVPTLTVNTLSDR